MPIPYQRTLASNASLEGTSLHTGEKVTLTMKPAPPNHGIVFRRIDLEDMPFIPASVDNVQQVERATERGMNEFSWYRIWICSCHHDLLFTPVNIFFPGISIINILFLLSPMK